MSRNSCWWTAGKPQWYPPRLLLQVLPNKFKCKDYITWTDKKWNQVCIQGPAPICMWSAPQKYQRDTTELTASGKTWHKEPWAQVSWCCQGPMAQIRTAEHLQDLLMGMKSKHHHVSDRTVEIRTDVPDLNTGFQSGQWDLVLCTRWGGVKWMHSGFYKCHTIIFFCVIHRI